MGRRSTQDNLFRPERAGGVVVLPGGHILRMSVDHTHDYVRQPARRTGSIVLGGSGGMVRMAVGNPNEGEALLSHIVVDPEEFEGIDRVAPRPVLRRDVPGPAGLQHPPRGTPVAHEETPTI